MSYFKGDFNMNSLIYRLNYCIEKEDYEQKIEVLEELKKIAEMRIEIYKSEIEYRNENSVEQE